MNELCCWDSCGFGLDFAILDFSLFFFGFFFGDRYIFGVILRIKLNLDWRNSLQLLQFICVFDGRNGEDECKNRCFTTALLDSRRASRLKKSFSTK